VPIRQALPSGVVIGEGAVGGNRGGSVPASLGMVGTRRSQPSDGSTIAGQADEQWQTLRGVAPVIAPDNRVVHHDPGPGVIGIDR
jgi:hypothetical protein